MRSVPTASRVEKPVLLRGGRLPRPGGADRTIQSDDCSSADLNQRKLDEVTCFSISPLKKVGERHEPGGTSYAH